MSRATHFFREGVSICGRASFFSPAATDWRKVTCQVCLRMRDATWARQ